MNIPYIVKTLKTEKLSELVANIDAPPLDVNLAIWDALDRGEIEIDEDNDSIKVVGEVTPTSNPDLSTKILRVVQHYADNQATVSRGRMNGYIKDPMTNQGYPWHEYITTMQHLVDQGTLVENTVEVPEKKTRHTDKKGRVKERLERPKHTFVFYGLPGNDNEEWNAAAINKWLADFEKAE